MQYTRMTALQLLNILISVSEFFGVSKAALATIVILLVLL